MVEGIESPSFSEALVCPSPFLYTAPLLINLSCYAQAQDHHKVSEMSMYGELIFLIAKQNDYKLNYSYNESISKEKEDYQVISPSIMSEEGGSC